MNWISTGIKSAHELAAFDCGKEQLNEWLRDSALDSENKWITRTYVWVTEDDPRVKAYFAITPTQVDSDADGLQQKFSTGLRTVPAFLLAKFAVDKSIKGTGMGEELSIDAVGRIVGAAQASGGRLIVVDAIDHEAFTFYVRYNFTPVKNTDSRLVMKMSTAQRAFGIGVTSDA